jgi:hypothetical protein
MEDRVGSAGSDRTVIFSAEAAAVPAKTARLVGLSGPPAQRDLSILPGRTRIGKAPPDSPGHHRIAIGQDSRMSRNHALMEFEGEDVTIADAGSMNGTYVNGTRVERAVLRPGDTVQLGESVFRFERSP